MTKKDLSVALMLAGVPLVVVAAWGLNGLEVMSWLASLAGLLMTMKTAKSPPPAPASDKPANGPASDQPTGIHEKIRATIVIRKKAIALATVTAVALASAVTLWWIQRHTPSPSPPPPTPTPTQAADEWTAVSSWGNVCDYHMQPVWGSLNNDSGSAARAHFTICWNDSYTDVRVKAEAWDDSPDGYHPEARVRYRVWTGSGWSSYHERTPAAAYGYGDHDDGAIYKANQKTYDMQARVCLYNGDTQIRCDAWR